MSDHKKNPESILAGPNVFFEVLHDFVPYGNWDSTLRQFPLATVPWQDLEPAYREPLLDSVSQHFVPSRDLFAPAADIQRLLRHAVDLLNPSRRTNQTRTNQVLLAKNISSVLEISSLEGAGAILTGITGSVKSKLLRRVLEVLVP